MLTRPSAADRKAALKRERNRRHYARRREGKVTITAEIDDVGISWLIACGYLNEAEAADVRMLRINVGRAVTLLLKISSR